MAQTYSPPPATLTASVTSCLALQPSTLSSTAMPSPLLCAPSTLLPSSLLSMENTQLKQSALLFPTLSSTLCSPHSLSPLLQSTLPPAGGLSSAFVAGASEEQTSAAQRKANTDSVSPCSAEDIPSHSAELAQDMELEDHMRMEQGLPSEMPVMELALPEEEERQTVDLGEEFGMVETSSAEQAEVLQDKKHELLNVVTCSLVSKSCAPGKKGWDDRNSQWSKIKTLASDISNSDPEFLLKVAVYTRKDLNFCIMANSLLALAAHLPASKPHLRKYFCTVVQLPSDWLDVPRIYSMCFSPSLPTCLKKALVDKFMQFSECQLAKYNTRKHRGKHRRKKCKALVQHTDCL